MLKAQATIIIVAAALIVVTGRLDEAAATIFPLCWTEGLTEQGEPTAVIGLHAPPESASDPAADPTVRKEGSEYTMWFNDAGPGQDRVMRSTSTQLQHGYVWSDPSPVYDCVGTNDALCKVVIKDGTYHLWVGADGGGYGAVNYATSSDGINWTQQGSVSNWYNYTVLPTDTGFEAWYRTYADNSMYHHVTSTDGLSWAPGDPANDMAADTGEALGSLDIMNLDGTYHMWYMANYQGNPAKFAYATYQGDPWDKHGLLCGVFEDVEDVAAPSVMLDDDGKLRMWYHIQNSDSDYHAAVPEPATLSLLTLGGLALLRRRRRLAAK